MLLANKLFFYGLPLLNYSQQFLWVNRKKPTYLLLTSATDFRCQNK